MSVLENLNYIKTVYTVPCVDDGLWIYIETGLTAAGLALVEFASFGCNDLLQLRAGKLPFCGRQIAPNFKKAWLGQDHDKYAKLFKILDPVEKTLFKWLLVDIGTGFIAKWHSLLFQTSNCWQDSNVITVAAEAAQGYGIAPGGPYRLTYSGKGGTPQAGVFVGHGFRVPRDWYWQCDFTYRVKKFDPFPLGNVSLYLKNDLAPFPDTPTCSFDPNVWFGPQYATCHRHGQASSNHQFTNYEFWYKLDGWGLADGGSMTLRMSKIPLIETHVSVLSCLKYTGSLLPGVDALNQEIPVPFLPSDAAINAATGILLAKAGIKL